MLNLGDMRWRVVIERRVATQDEAGQPTDEWVNVARRRAAVMALAGREAFAAQQRLGRVPTIFRLRYLDGIEPKMRLTCDGKRYDIDSAFDPDGMREELRITALELVEEAVGV